MWLNKYQKNTMFQDKYGLPTVSDHSGKNRILLSDKKIVKIIDTESWFLINSVPAYGQIILRKFELLSL